LICYVKHFLKNFDSVDDAGVVFNALLVDSVCVGIDSGARISYVGYGALGNIHMADKQELDDAAYDIQSLEICDQEEDDKVNEMVELIE